MKITIVDLNAELIAALEAIPSDVVACGVGDIFDCPADAIVSPANSFGFMDGGIDLAYCRRFGWEIEKAVRAKIASDFGGELLVGQALSVDTGDEKFPHLVSAPTMRVPMNILDPTNVRLAARAAIREAVRLGVESVVMPGLGTGSGRVREVWGAKMMVAGINDALAPKTFTTLAEAARDQFDAYPAQS